MPEALDYGENIKLTEQQFLVYPKKVMVVFHVTRRAVAGILPGHSTSIDYFFQTNISCLDKGRNSIFHTKSFNIVSSTGSLSIG